MKNLEIKKKITVVLILIFTTIVVMFEIVALKFFIKPEGRWIIKSIDTMKVSRDLAREKINDQDFDYEIDQQLKLIAATGASHVAIGTPYDDEFTPYLKRWVKYARKNKLNVWFRGNFSGWEGWFGYEKIDRQEHKSKIQRFILTNRDLFADGDAFSSCPECENGGPGDPRETHDIKAYRDFLIDEYLISKNSFKKIGKKVESNYFSMNFDVAKIIMDEDTTKKIDGIVTIDHYVKNPEDLVKDIDLISKISKGKIILGEVGVPIPDIHGPLDEKAQAQWMEKLLNSLKKNKNLFGINYWVHKGGTTQLWEASGKPRMAVGVIEKLFREN